MIVPDTAPGRATNASFFRRETWEVSRKIGLLGDSQCVEIAHNRSWILGPCTILLVTVVSTKLKYFLDTLVRKEKRYKTHVKKSCVQVDLVNILSHCWGYRTCSLCSRISDIFKNVSGHYSLLCRCSNLQRLCRSDCLSLRRNSTSTLRNMD